MSNNLLGLIGLCKRAGMLAVGEEPADACCRARDTRLLLLASDAADNTARRVRHFAEEGACLSLRVPFTKYELGRSVGRSSCAILAVTDIGFASSIAHRLAEDDPKQYSAIAEKLDIKAKRMLQRREELKAHEKNLREGRKKAPQTSESAPVKKTERTSAGKVPARTPSRAPSRTAQPGRPKTGSAPRRSYHSGEKAPEGTAGGEARRSAGRPGGAHSSAHRPFKSDRRRAKPANPYRFSKPVKKGKGSFHKKDET
ncbi:MAG: 50S ribosomal protein L7 [Oscillibacter sp.]|nr:50S ribosomal protein L7 [Oscillibacter sp.]